MPFHWIDGETLWFPPEGKSEAVNQLVHKATWRQYRIRCSYWETRTFNRKEAEQKANQLRRQEEREAQEASETSTDADAQDVGGPQPVGKQAGEEANVSVPPSAPKVVGVSVLRRKLLPKPPPSVHMLKCKRKRRQSPPSRTTSDEEEEDPTWIQPIKKGNEKKQFITAQKRIQPHKPAKSGSARTATETTTPTSSLHRESRPTATLREQQRETMTTSAQQQSSADLPQQPETMSTQASEPQRQSEPTAAPSICLLQQSETTTTPTSSVQRQLETLASRADLPQVVCQLAKIRKQLEEHVANVSQEFANVNQQLTHIETLLRDRSALSSDTAQSEVSGLAAAREQLTQEQRCLLRRSPMVINDEQWAELEATLVDNGRYGPFFSALVRTVKDRIVDRSDVHKTANATLMALVAEPYLAQRVTMAGYKKRKI